MSSNEVSVRESIASYELENNALIEALSPGGILFYCVEKGPLEALLVPREISLQYNEIAPFLRLGATLPSAAVTGAKPAEVRRPSDGATPQERQLQERLAQVTAEQHRAITSVLRLFLTYHLIHVDTMSTQFTTVHGHRGTFSDALDSVRRFGHGEKVAVVADADPIRPASDVYVSPCHPSKLSIFFLEEPLMDEVEMRNLKMSLQSALTPLRGTSVGRRSETHSGAPSSTQLAKAKVMDDLFGTLAATESFGSPPKDKAPKGKEVDREKVKEPRHTLTAAEPSQAVPERANPPPLLDVMNMSDESDDVVVEDDLTPYASRTQQRILHEQARRSVTESRRKSDSGAAGANAESRDGGNGTGARVSSAPATKPAETEGNSAARPDARSSIKHTNVVQHEYSRESISNYRRVVSADNEINYNEFVRLMASPMCYTLARMVSSFVESVQRHHADPEEDHSFCDFVNKFTEEMYRIDAIARDPRVCTILGEGVEKYTTSKLFKFMYGPSDRVKKKNLELDSKLELLAGLTAQQLDALEEVEDHHVWGQAMFELDGMNFFRSPRDKLRSGMRACELLSLALRDVLKGRADEKRAQEKKTKEEAACAQGEAAAAGADREKKKEPSHPSAHRGAALAFGADEFVPCFMLLVLRARPYNFYTNVHYITAYRTPSLMSPEEGYCLANLSSAASFFAACDEKGQMPPPDYDAVSDKKSNHAAGKGRASGPASPRDESRKLSRNSRSTLSTPSSAASHLPPPPQLMESDLLPSLKGSVAGGPGGTGTTNSIRLQDAASVMDTLFGWTTPQVKMGASPDDDAARGKRKSAERTPATTTATTTAATGSAGAEEGHTKSSPLHFFQRFAHNGKTNATPPPSVPAAPAPAVKPPVAVGAVVSNVKREPSPAVKNIIQGKKNFEDLSEDELRILYMEMKRLCGV